MKESSLDPEVTQKSPRCPEERWKVGRHRRTITEVFTGEDDLAHNVQTGPEQAHIAGDVREPGGDYNRRSSRRDGQWQAWIFAGALDERRSLSLGFGVERGFACAKCRERCRPDTGSPLVTR